MIRGFNGYNFTKISRIKPINDILSNKNIALLSSIISIIFLSNLRYAIHKLLVSSSCKLDTELSLWSLSDIRLKKVIRNVFDRHLKLYTSKSTVCTELHGVGNISAS
jgi:hypothetical protein